MIERYPEAHYERTRHDNEVRAAFWVGYFGGLIGGLILGIVFGLAMAGIARAENVGQVPQDVLEDPRSMEWFKQPRIKACCDVADGYVTEFEFNQQENSYRIPSKEDPKVWIKVPDIAVVTAEMDGTPIGNPTGYAWVWWYKFQNPDGSTPIRCFVPNGGA